MKVEATPITLTRTGSWSDYAERLAGDHQASRRPVRAVAVMSRALNGHAPACGGHFPERSKAATAARPGSAGRGSLSVAPLPGGSHRRPTRGSVAVHHR